MLHSFYLQRTTTANANFQKLVAALDHELWDELKEDQATYDQYNKVPDIKTAVLIYINEQAVACGCFKEFDKETVEVKRMFVAKSSRGKGLSKEILNELERWAMEEGYQYAVLETSIHFKTARNLYETNGYAIIPNYGQYEGLKESVCMKKNFIEK